MANKACPLRGAWMEINNPKAERRLGLRLWETLKIDVQVICYFSTNCWTAWAACRGVSIGKKCPALSRMWMVLLGS
jgi:hypothetical protein